MNLKYLSVIGSRDNGRPLIETRHPFSATTESTLIPTVSPGAVGMIATFSSSRSLKSGVDCIEIEQSAAETATFASADQQIASRLAEFEPENTVAPGAGLSQAVRPVTAARATMASTDLTTVERMPERVGRRDMVGAVGTVHEATLATRALDFR